MMAAPPAAAALRQPLSKAAAKQARAAALAVLREAHADSRRPIFHPQSQAGWAKLCMDLACM